MQGEGCVQAGDLKECLVGGTFLRDSIGCLQGGVLSKVFYREFYLGRCPGYRALRGVFF